MLVKTPIDILSTAIEFKDLRYKTELMDMIRSLYRYELFKPMLDMCATLVQEKRLVFFAHPKEFFELDEGNCVTIEGGTFDKFTNMFRSRKTYKITIKKMAADVLIHEIGHMLEHECGVALNNDFMSAAHADISQKHSGNVSLNSAIKQVMVDEVKPYPASQQPSELFTRFFQLLAMTKQVAGYNAKYGFAVEDFYKAFPNLSRWYSDKLMRSLSARINPHVASASQAYIVKPEDIKHEWAKERIKPTHNPHAPKGSKWSSSVKSIKD